MRFFYPLLFAILIAIIGSSWYHMVVGADPREEAVAFLQSVESGKLAKTVKHFGSNVCRCPHKGGWGAYLVYASAQEPNLAFITGHPFTLAQPSLFRMTNNVQALLPWQKPEDTVVDVPISFDASKYSPLFLPLKMAYGQTMSESEFNEFLSDPDRDAWKGLTLRFRPSLEKGAIAPPAEPLPISVKSEFHDLVMADTSKKGADDEIKKEQNSEESTEEAIKKTLGADKIAFLHPRDPGSVLNKDGRETPAAEIATRLPRLKSAVVRLHVVRRGATSDWTIYHFGIMNPVLIFPDGHEVAIQHFVRPSASEAERAVKQLHREFSDQADIKTRRSLDESVWQGSNKE